MTIKKEILLVGTMHFAQQGNLIKEKVLEILEVVNYLDRCRPTKIAVEVNKSEAKSLNERFRKEDIIFKNDEVEQIGFRLAKQLKHPYIYPINWEGSLTENNMLDLHQVIQSNYPDIQKKISDFTEKDVGISHDVRLLESYQQLNNTKILKDLEAMYLSFVVVEDNYEPIGAYFLTKWIEREMMIFKHIEEISELEEERTLLIVGSDHLWMLRKLLEGNGWGVINPFG
ncbi:DUF5694 domain-containing protein [Aquibacillus rhizosphaerae]|uniref:DUF5694 domain-containing protein n=1 Tax=Aquibacillus rhizosphaerae TaxID=3051431 RepID=A0ABT7L8U3_9BACI|nr:DUF5694 domain-containing protein [Aquibacillus sp. LR5S19]MDL4842291.1 DUF5694 domain-containing protein [Aquibacillus sp. LR5S19]